MIKRTGVWWRARTATRVDDRTGHSTVTEQRLEQRLPGHWIQHLTCNSAISIAFHEFSFCTPSRLYALSSVRASMYQSNLGLVWEYSHASNTRKAAPTEPALCPPTVSPGCSSSSSSLTHVSHSLGGFFILQLSTNNRKCLESLSETHQDQSPPTSSRRPHPNMRHSQRHSCCPSRAAPGARSIPECV